MSNVLNVYEPAGPCPRCPSDHTALFEYPHGIWFHCFDCGYRASHRGGPDPQRDSSEKLKSLLPDVDVEPDDTCHCGHPECGAC